jgi:hypothetical protein
VESLGVAICVIIVGGILTGLILITLDRQKEWKARREHSKK